MQQIFKLLIDLFQFNKIAAVQIQRISVIIHL